MPQLDPNNLNNQRPGTAYGSPADNSGAVENPPSESIPRVTPPATSNPTPVVKGTPTGDPSQFFQSAMYDTNGNLTGYKNTATGVVTPSGRQTNQPVKTGNSAADYLSGSGFTPPPTEDQNYKTLLDRASSLITDTGKSFQDEINAKNASSAARVNAGGLAGSSAGGTITEEAIKPVVDARNLALDKIYSDIQTNAQNLTLNEKQLADTEATAAVAEQKAQKADSLKTASASIAALAANHLDWNAYKTSNADNYNALVTAVGGDPNVADAMFAMSVPAPEIVSSWTTSDGKGGTTVWQQRTDPVTKQPSIVKYDMPGVPIPGNWTSDKLGTNSQIFKSPDFVNDPTNPKNFMIVSTDPTNNGAITITKDGKTTVNGIGVNEMPSTNPTSAVVGASGTVASIVGLQDPTTPLSAVIADPAIGIEGIITGIIQNEGGSPKGVVNNPGNIKFVGAPGQTNSGVKAKDGGTFASYPTKQDGTKAIADLITKGAQSGKNFDEFVNAYTGTGTTASPSGSILSATNISLPVFNYLTQGVASMSRMSASDRKRIMNQATDFLNSKGIDVSTFQSQYKTYNDVLSSNIQRYAKTQIMENELKGTVDNLKTVVSDKDLGKINIDNVAKVWAGQQVNDDLSTQYAFHFEQLKNELAGYFAASQGKASPDVIDNQDAAGAVLNGMSTGSLNGFKTSIENSTTKMAKVLQDSVNSAQKNIWSLFGVGDKFNNPNAEADNKVLSSTEAMSQPEGTTATMTDGTPATFYGGKWYDSSGNNYDSNGNKVVNPSDKTVSFLNENGIDVNSLQGHHISALNDSLG